MKEESTWAPTNSLDDELKLRDYYKPKMEPQQSSPQTNNFVPNASMGAFQAIRQQHIMQQRQQLNESSELINRLVMHQPLAQINPQMTSNQALGLIRYYDQMKQSSAPVVQSESYSNPPESPPPVSTV